MDAESVETEQAGGGVAFDLPSSGEVDLAAEPVDEFWDVAEWE